jgi:hypothetical protein
VVSDELCREVVYRAQLRGGDVAKHENAAAELVRAWGFAGIGSVPFEDRPS